MKKLIAVALTLLALAGSLAVSAVATVRIKDITTVRGVRANQLIGYGLVSGLKGTGDSLSNAPFTELSVRSMLERLGVNVRKSEARTRNVAAVIITAELPAFAGTGTKIDVTVASIGDASSLVGGALIRTPLYGPDGKIYAVAQGAVIVSGFDAKGQNETLTSGVPTAGRISGGALVERKAPGQLAAGGTLTFDLKNPDFATSVAITDAINTFLRRAHGRAAARVDGPGTVHVKLPPRTDPTRMVAAIGALRVQPDVPARVVVDERTGTIVIGHNVKVTEVAVAHGNLTVRVTETPNVSQPLPFSDGQTVVTTDTAVEAREEEGRFVKLKGVNLDTLVAALNMMGLKPQGIIAILQATKTAGALQAELVVQ
ncbi:MAG: flagellar basal body P-ring protein FlgI [Pseudomonadota bacterium]